MRTEFVRIPEFFVIRYDDEMQAWGRNFGRIGPVKSFILKEGPFADVSPDPEMGPVLIRVRLLAKMERAMDKVTVAPYEERDEEQIRRHCEKLVRRGVHPRHFWKEEPRAWLPFMPGMTSNDNGR